MVIGSRSVVVFLPFIPVYVLGLVYLLLRRAHLLLLALTRSSVWVRVLTSVVVGWLVCTVIFFCCDSPLLCAGDRCGGRSARASDAVIPIVYMLIGFLGFIFPVISLASCSVIALVFFNIAIASLWEAWVPNVCS